MARGLRRRAFLFDSEPTRTLFSSLAPPWGNVRSHPLCIASSPNHPHPRCGQTLFPDYPPISRPGCRSSGPSPTVGFSPILRTAAAGSCGFPPYVLLSPSSNVCARQKVPGQTGISLTGRGLCRRRGMPSYRARKVRSETDGSCATCAVDLRAPVSLVLQAGPRPGRG